EPKRQRAQFLIDSLAIRNAHKLSALNESRVSNRQKKREFFNKLTVAGLPNRTRRSESQFIIDTYTIRNMNF
ncbi:MAG TPA: hypothetical protein VFW23_04385, partial [Tepidisphaeraceae bacterium]|nr:hypothetical protein [Tepidisphaeraceae bacterium]